MKKFILIFALLFVANYFTAQSLYIKGSRVGEIESDGDIYIKGSRKGQIESDGDVYRNGSRIGQIEADGDIYLNGSRVVKLRAMEMFTKMVHALDKSNQMVIFIKTEVELVNAKMCVKIGWQRSFSFSSLKIWLIN